MNLFLGDFDIIGPYFTCAKTLDIKYLYSCLMETIKLFYLHGLKTIVIFCDGASSKLATIKASHGASGVYQLNRGTTCKCM